MAVIYERLNDTLVDIPRLIYELRSHVLKYEPVMPKPAFGGWSILSASGSYKDGWQPGHLCYKHDQDGNQYYDAELAKQLGVRPSAEHVVLTEISSPYVIELIDSIRSLGLEPCRARWTVLRANSQGVVHRDAPDDQYAVRLHVPVITNAMCRFDSEGESEHAPADGAMYLVKVNRLHQIFNLSNEDRYHIIMNVTDRKAVSQYHRFG